LPTVVASIRTVNVVEAPAASVVAPKPEVTVNPASTVMGVVNVRLLVPRFLTVNVRLTAVPTTVLPKASLPVPSGISVVPSSTWISGAAEAMTVNPPASE